MKKFTLIKLSLLLSAGITSSSAFALPLTANQILQQFNLVTFGNASSSSEVDGRSFIGGMLNGGVFANHPANTPASDYAGLTVQGSADHVMVNAWGAVIEGNLLNSTINSGSSTVFGNASGNNFNGAAYVQGSSTQNNFNGGHDASLATGPAAVAATSTDFNKILTGLSSQLSHLASTGSSVILDAYGKATFNAIANADGLAVFDLSGIDTAVFKAGEFQFNLNGAKTVIINSDEKSASIAANFLAGSAQDIGAKTIWNFYNASQLNINHQFGGSVLAPLAAFSNGNNIEGGVFVKTLDQHGEIHLQPFSGQIPAIPEPETYSLIGLGLVGILITRQRKARKLVTDKFAI